MVSANDVNICTVMNTSPSRFEFESMARYVVDEKKLEGSWVDRVGSRRIRSIGGRRARSQMLAIVGRWVDDACG
jgi:hypothetical protein